MYCTYQFSLKYFAGDIKYKRLIKAANHEDLPGLYPRLGRKKRNFLSRCISHKCNKKILSCLCMMIEGSEVISKNKETIRNLYEKYKEWIPDYKRESIDKLFK
ncbi:DUF3885 domain-containing protein [Bacillus paranthracis]